MNYCSHCGAKVVQRIPEGDSALRHVCDGCGTIHYRNPLMVIGSIPVSGDRVLLCKRAIEPRSGYWTLPAGFMELGETTGEAAIRETLEEANARIDLGDLYTVFSVRHANQVHMFYRAQLRDLDFSPGIESLEVALFREDEIPWDDLAFRTIVATLRHFFADRRSGEFRTHAGDIAPAG